MGREIISKRESFTDPSDIAREIMAYLHDHPDAQDSIEGIMKWWLLERDITFQAAMIRKALAKLVKEGSIIEVIRPTGNIYRLK